MNDAETRDDRETKKKKNLRNTSTKETQSGRYYAIMTAKLSSTVNRAKKKDHSTLKTVEDGRRRKKASETFFF